MTRVGRALLAVVVAELAVVLVDPLTPGHILAIAAQPLILLVAFAYLTDPN
jgi:hypothetical protein